jgi:hypothetical protein
MTSWFAQRLVPPTSRSSRGTIIRTDQKIWIGLLEVKPLPGNPDHDKFQGGAFVQLVGPADDGSDFVARAREAAVRDELSIHQIQDIEPLDLRQGIDPDLLELAEIAASSGEMRFGTFVTYPEDE